MKQKYLVPEYLTVLIFIILPPLFTSGSSSENISIAGNGTTSPVIIIQFMTAFLLDLQFRKFIRTGNDNIKNFKSLQYFRIFSLTFLLLFSIQLTINFIGLFAEPLFTRANLNFSLGSIDEHNFISGPSNFLSWILVTVNFLFSAYFEECIYRQFFPETTLIFLRKYMEEKELDGKKTKRLSYATEFLCILIFALSHLYLGMMPALNAFLCGYVLRICYKKTGSVYTGFLAHFLYNLILYAILSAN